MIIYFLYILLGVHSFPPPLHLATGLTAAFIGAADEPRAFRTARPMFIKDDLESRFVAKPLASSPDLIHAFTRKAIDRNTRKLFASRRILPSKISKYFKMDSSLTSNQRVNLPDMMSINIPEKFVMESVSEATIAANRAAEAVQLELTSQLQAMMKQLGDNVQREVSAEAGLFVGKNIRKYGILVAARLIEAKYISGIGSIAAQTTRSLISDDIISTLLEDSVVREANNFVSKFKANVGDKLLQDMKKSDSLILQLKLASEGFTQDVLSKGGKFFF